MQMIRIDGVIVSGSSNRLKVKRNDDGRICVLISESPIEKFLPSDCISCEVRETDDEDVFAMEGLPLISMLMNDEPTIMRILFSIQRQYNASDRPVKMTMAGIKAFYNHIKSKLPVVMNGEAIIHVDDYISQFSYLVRNEDTTGYMSAFTGGMDTNLMNAEKITYILKKWYVKVDLRLLGVMGIVNKIKTDGKEVRMIEESVQSARRMYKLLSINPMYLHTVPLDLSINIAKAFGIELEEEDIEAGKILRKIADITINNGNTCYKYKNFLNRFNPKKYVLKRLIEAKPKHRKWYPPPCVVENDVLYIREVRDIEEGTCSYLANLLNRNDIPYAKDLSTLTQNNDNEITPDIDQLKAIMVALRANISIITGSAGTGKTSIIKKIISVLECNKIKYALTSFTGKATSRMRECCNTDAATIDLMIVKKNCYHFNHIIIDEMSMCSLLLINRLIKAFNHSYRITFIGDPNQLEPIGWGHIFKEMIKSYTLPVNKLTTIHRVKTEFGENDLIIENSRRISYWRDADFDFFCGSNFKIVKGDYQDLIKEIRQFHDRGVELKDLMIITPYNNLIPNINRVVQIFYNHRNKHVKRTSNGWSYCTETSMDNLMNPIEAYYVGDKVMSLVNNRAHELDNGESGIVTDVSLEGVTVEFRNKKVLFSLKDDYTKYTARDDDENENNSFVDTSSISLAMCITVHKSQGDQCDNIIFFSHRWTPFITRNMAYTAVTRAIKSVTIIMMGNWPALSVQNLPKEKYSTISVRLRNHLQQKFVVVEEDLMKAEIIKRREQVMKLYSYDQYDDDYY